MTRVQKSIQMFEGNINGNTHHPQPCSLIVLACGDDEGAQPKDQMF